MTLQRVGSESSVSPATSRKYEFRLGLNSDVGKKRGENQDAFGYAQTASESLFIVADGMGGSQGGATASTVAVNIVTKNTFGADKKLTPNSLSKSILAANEAVFNL